MEAVCGIALLNTCICAALSDAHYGNRSIDQFRFEIRSSQRLSESARFPIQVLPATPLTSPFVWVFLRVGVSGFPADLSKLSICKSLRCPPAIVLNSDPIPNSSYKVHANVQPHGLSTAGPFIETKRVLAEHTPHHPRLCRRLHLRSSAIPTSLLVGAPAPEPGTVDSTPLPARPDP